MKEMKPHRLTARLAANRNLRLPQTVKPEDVESIRHQVEAGDSSIQVQVGSEPPITLTSDNLELTLSLLERSGQVDVHRASLDGLIQTIVVPRLEGATPAAPASIVISEADMRAVAASTVNALDQAFGLLNPHLVNGSEDLVRNILSRFFQGEIKAKEEAMREIQPYLRAQQGIIF